MDLRQRDLRGLDERGASHLPRDDSLAGMSSAGARVGLWPPAVRVRQPVEARPCPGCTWAHRCGAACLDDGLVLLSLGDEVGMAEPGQGMAEISHGDSKGEPGRCGPGLC